MAIEATSIGSIVMLSTGSYSDYGVNGFAEVLKPIDEEVWASMKIDCGNNPSRTFSWFIAQGYLKEIDFKELHVGEYYNIKQWKDV